jgi:uncharacterized repeat protein (TIGR01451 family)
VLSASTNDDKIAWYENRGGQFALATNNTAPANLAEGQMDDLLKIVMRHRGRSGDSDEELTRLRLRFQTTGGTPLTTAELQALLQSLRVYRDDGSGSFEVGSDTLAVNRASGSLTLSNGELNLAFSDGNANAQVTLGTPVIYFVVAELQINAAGQSPNKFRVSHIVEGANRSAAEDRAADLPLSLEYSQNVNSTLVTVTSTIANVVIVKQVSPAGPIEPGQPLTYTLTYINVGGSLAQNVVITDIVPLTVTDVISSRSGAVITPVAGSQFVWRVQNLAPNEGGIITLAGQINPGLTSGGQFTNTAIIKASNDTTPANNRSSVGITVVVPVDEDGKVYLPVVIK